MSSPPRGREYLWATTVPKPKPATWPLPRLFRGGQARDGAEARVPVATAPLRGGPRPSWYVRVRGGPTRGEPSHPTGSTGAAPPYTCGAPLGCVPAAAPTWLTHRVNGWAPAPTAALQRPIPVGARQPASSEEGQELAQAPPRCPMPRRVALVTGGFRRGSDRRDRPKCCIR